MPSTHYGSRREYLFALADAIKHEYKAVVEAGFILQIDDPALPDTYDMIVPNPTIEEYRKIAAIRVEALNQALVSQDGSENIMAIWRELGDTMTEHVTVTRINTNLEAAYHKLLELEGRFRKVNLSDRSRWSNQTLNFARELGNMLVLARVITMGAYAGYESRGAHYKPEFPNRDDANWLKTTRAKWNGGEIQLTYEPVDISLISPRPRRYDAAK